MSLTLKQIVIVQTWLEERVIAIKAAVDKNFKATGKTRDSVRGFIEGDSAIIEGSSILEFGEFGRGPTKNGTPPGKLRDIIREWIDVKGISPRGGISKDTLAYLITRKIHRDGIKVPNRFNEGGILSSVLNDAAIQELLNEFGETLIAEFESDLLTVLNIE